MQPKTEYEINVSRKRVKRWKNSKSLRNIVYREEKADCEEVFFLEPRATVFQIFFNGIQFVAFRSGLNKSKSI